MSQQTNSITLDVKPLVAALRRADLFTLEQRRAWCLRLEYMIDVRHMLGHVPVQPFPAYLFWPSKVDGG
jgi:hypothetical protein